jgi:dynein heavy chain
MDGIIHAEQLPRIKEMVDSYLDSLVVNVNTMKQAIQSETSNLVASCLRLIQIFLNKENIKLDDKDIDADRVVNNYVAFSVIWSIGANVHDSDRSKFALQFKKRVRDYPTDFLNELDIYEQGIDPKTHKF